jgi:hypothetical protein
MCTKFENMSYITLYGRFLIRQMLLVKVTYLDLGVSMDQVGLGSGQVTLFYYYFLSDPNPT